MAMPLPFRSLLVSACLLTAVACGDDGDAPPAADSTGAATSASSGGNDGATGQVATTSADSTGGGGVGSSGMADGSFLNPDSSGDDGPTPPQPNGSPCMGEADCESGMCYSIPMVGGVCSECLTDDDCEMGTCALDPTALYAVCTDGSQGVMCSSDEGCMGELVCSELINTGGLFPLNFCSQCRDDVPCPEGETCTPVYDLENFGGYLGCAGPGSVENGGGCPIEGVSGDGTVCASGFCGVVTLLDLLPVGVCGECLTDEDCEAVGLTTCNPGAADMTGVMGATCS